ncbi:ribbon-helix-helix domain-containing protein [Gaopeijia maritima]|uniref:ribbon-helix-helix domain-containing protein n=1 Tax=Gaopeijia maritima TaxID=3119007 RepID=UPI00386AE844
MRTTVYLDGADYRQLKALARAEGRSAAELIRVAVAEYTARHRGQALPASLGIADTGVGTLSEDAERLLEGYGRD